MIYFLIIIIIGLFSNEGRTNSGKKENVHLFISFFTLISSQQNIHNSFIILNQLKIYKTTKISDSVGRVCLKWDHEMGRGNGYT